jgi:hypothetical protein
MQSSTTTLVLLALILQLALGLDVSISAGKTAGASSIHVSGTSSHVITSGEVGAFGLNDAKVRSAVEKYFGKKPAGAWLKSPTTDHLYNEYGWKQVTVNLKATKAQILSVSSKPVILNHKTLENKSSKTATFDASITAGETQSSTSGWSSSETIKVSQSINYDIKFLGTGAGGSTSLDYTQGFGQSGSKTTSTTVGDKTGVSVTLKPGQKVVAELEAGRGSLKARVTYEVTLSGDIAVSYGTTKYKDHYFWGLDVNKVMSSVGNKLTKTVTEDIECGYYADGHVTLKDSASSLLRGSQLPEIKLAKPGGIEYLIAQE